MIEIIITKNQISVAESLTLIPLVLKKILKMLAKPP